MPFGNTLIIFVDLKVLQKLNMGFSFLSIFCMGLDEERNYFMNCFSKMYLPTVFSKKIASNFLSSENLFGFTVNVKTCHNLSII